MFLLCTAKSAMTKILSSCWDFCSSHEDDEDGSLADEPSISPKLILQYTAVVMLIRFLLTVLCKRAEKCETGKKIVERKLRYNG